MEKEYWRYAMHKDPNKKEEPERVGHLSVAGTG
jgi:hypothetical protein